MVDVLPAGDEVVEDVVAVGQRLENPRDALLAARALEEALYPSHPLDKAPDYPEERRHEERSRRKRKDEEERDRKPGREHAEEKRPQSGHRALYPGPLASHSMYLRHCYLPIPF